MGRETILRQYIDTVKPLYEWIIIDTSPSLGLLTINALTAADSVLIPVTPKFLDVKGLELLLRTIAKVRKQINTNLTIGGILLTMVDRRSNFTREIISLIERSFQVIGLFVNGDYLPLKSFTTFGAFPDCGQEWNLFLLYHLFLSTLYYRFVSLDCDEGFISGVCLPRESDIFVSFG